MSGLYERKRDIVLIKIVNNIIDLVDDEPNKKRVVNRGRDWKLIKYRDEKSAYSNIDWDDSLYCFQNRSVTRKAIFLKQRLAWTLRFLATGESFRSSLEYQFRISRKAIKMQYLFKFCVQFLFIFVNSIRSARFLNQMSSNDGKTDDETKRLSRKWFFQQNCFWSALKTLASFSGVSFVKKHEGNKWRNTKNLIKNLKFLVCFSRFAWALLFNRCIMKCFFKESIWRNDIKKMLLWKVFLSSPERKGLCCRTCY